MTLPTLCEHCHNRAHRDDIKCTESCYSLDAYNKEFAKAIAARDKWWVDNMRLMFIGCCESTCKYMTPDCAFLNDACMAWQQYKLSLQSSAALINLMGNFPDLPDEVGQ